MKSRQEGTVSRRRGLDRATIVAAALEMADSQGQVPTIRVIAGAVGSSPMALYRHVPDKETLVGLLVEEVYAELDQVDLDTAATAQQVLQVIGGQATQTFARHPWFPRQAAATPPQGTAGLDFTEHCLAALQRCGSTAPDAATALGAVMTYATGAAILAPQAVTDGPPHHEDVTTPDLGAWPLVHELALGEHQVADVGLDALVAGLTR